MTGLASNYLRHQIQSVSRAELLVRLYRAAISKIDTALALDAHAAGSSDVTVACLKAAGLIQAIQVGLDFSQGEVPQNINRLCEYAMHQILSRERDGLVAARNVLSTLAEGYEAVMEESVQYEREHMPPVPTHGALIDSTC